ncbi:methyl-accepting chemotaxis protein [Kineosporia sp. J2-2]|uniref:Methyl-accepting chemotaxis protein n=1 Tax=Kineosporia corallincola TaxID=2835133 RepID=A0ABS5TFP4_9ACTN|nr:methyl-accepting chemotaxis protein [Kineosporia corallincola]MBT0769905.1 methyl-accepting chemotaxis protein [Kineosporia corallincola]
MTTDMAEEEGSLLSQRQDAAASSASLARDTIVGAGLVLLVVMAAIATGMTRSISSRVERIRQAIGALAKGDLTHSAQLSPTDEFGLMGRDLDMATATLRASITELAGDAVTLSSAASELSSISDSLTSGAQEASGKATQAAESADEVNGSVQSVASGAEEMTASIREIASTASQAADVANESLQMAQTTGSQLTELGEASTQIGDVVRLITSIAEQTNLLALNATIEAARAGDAGKGFAVVADEVKQLAQETARATEDITARIDAIQSKSDAASQAVQRIGEVISQIAQFSVMIASAVEEQSATTREMTESINTAAQSSNQVLVNFSTVAEITDATSRSASASRVAAGNLTTVAGQLNALVSRFRH